MAVNKEPILKRCRYLGISPMVMGISKESNRNPGANNRKKLSEYGMQLRAKQMTRRFYGVLENQFRHYYEMGTKMPGKAGDNLLILLESRLDNVVYRCGWASSRAEARQLVVHGHFTVNGKKVDIPSYLVKPGELVAIKDGSRQSDKFKAVIESNSSRPVPKWLDVDAANAQAKIAAMPAREDIDLEVDETLIVELYSK